MATVSAALIFFAMSAYLDIRYQRLFASDIDRLFDYRSIVDFDPEIADRAFQLGMPEQQLDHAKMSGAPIDQGDLRSAYARMSRASVRLSRTGRDVRRPWIDPPPSVGQASRRFRE